MSLNRAIVFVKEYLGSQEFRQECYQFSRAELLEHYGFTMFEFEDAINMRLVKCMTHEDANMLKQIKYCLDLI